MRLTGDYLGRPARGGPRTTVRQAVRFFKDTEDLTEIRWYGVPGDRPVLPYPSFVANEAWTNDNGPFSGMLYGFPPSHQGVQEDGPHYESVNPQDLFNPHHFCGTRGQWAGDLRTDRPSDVGDPNCCGVVKGRASLSIRPRSAWSIPGLITSCVLCPGGTAATWYVQARGFLGGMTIFNGDWACTYQGGCVWSITVGPIVVNLVGGPGFQWRVNFTRGLVPQAHYFRLSGFNCLSRNSLPFFSQTGGGTAAPFVIASPFAPSVFEGFSVRAGLVVTPRSVWRRSYSFAGQAGLVITPRSEQTPTYGDPMSRSGPVITPRSSWASGYPTDCAFCPGGLANNRYFTCGSWSGPFAGLPANFTLPYTSPCTYSGVISGFTVTATVGAGNSADVFFDDGAGNSAYYSQGALLDPCFGSILYTPSGTNPPDAAVTMQSDPA